MAGQTDRWRQLGSILYLVAVCNASTLLFETQAASDFDVDNGFEIDITNTGGNALFSGVGYLDGSEQPDYFGFGNAPFFSCNRCRHNNTPSPMRWTWSVPKPASHTTLYVSMLVASSVPTTDGFEIDDRFELDLGTTDILRQGLQAVNNNFSHWTVNGKLLTPTSQRVGKIVTVASSAATLTLQLTVLTTSDKENIAFGSLKVYACDSTETGRMAIATCGA
jgi:hypothetical protein